MTVGALIRHHALDHGAQPAFLTANSVTTWVDYDDGADRVAGCLLAAGVERSDRVAVVMPDSPGVHATFVGCERIGAVVVGIGYRAGLMEIEHLLAKTGASVLVTQRGGRPDLSMTSADVQSVVLPVDLRTLSEVPVPSGRALGANDLFLINSTSGTTGLPKCVMHSEARWLAYHPWAVEAGSLTDRDVFFSAIPTPFGFGLWTAHFSPAILGCPTVLSEKFEAGQALDLIEKHRVTVLACVSTQFVMMLNEQLLRPRDVSSLRCMFTGGEAVPYAKAAAFEEEFDATVLQFYGSNETGALSRTTVSDPRERRLRTAGRVLEEMQVRLFDPAGNDITGERRPGIPGCRGPATCLGYYADEEANAKLMTPDGWMLMGDIVEIDGDGYLTVVGRTSDFIIRGGKNISATAVEDEVATHPGVVLAAAVAMEDEVFGEKVCVYVEVRPGWENLTLGALTDHLTMRGVTKEWLPERLIVVESLPRSSGGKVAKGALRNDMRTRPESEK
ncbi:MAG TPA: class I adenylate-forming enzyme family protein [Acidimicrobiales bacterium]|nr:class I adenylate-forming enzyme family protein [Acidimicrobiales bacterium]